MTPIALAEGKEAPVIDGFTGDQRFFIAYAPSWATKMRDERCAAHRHRRPRARQLPRADRPQHRRLVQGVQREAGRETVSGAGQARESLVNYCDLRRLRTVGAGLHNPTIAARSRGVNCEKWSRTISDIMPRSFLVLPSPVW
jgi:hypothetical protein